MGGGILQLSILGSQDAYLTGNPQITFFKSVYRRHTNFSIETIKLDFPNATALEKQISIKLPRNGDLIHKMYIEYSPNNIRKEPQNGNPGDSDYINGYISRIGPNFSHNLLKEIELTIGGKLIDKHYGHWLTVLNELTEYNPTKIKNPISTQGKEPENASKYDILSFNHRGIEEIPVEKSFMEIWNNTYSNLETGGKLVDADANPATPDTALVPNNPYENIDAGTVTERELVDKEIPLTVKLDKAGVTHTKGLKYILYNGIPVKFGTSDGNDINDTDVQYIPNNLRGIHSLSANGGQDVLYGNDNIFGLISETGSNKNIADKIMLFKDIKCSDNDAISHYQYYDIGNTLDDEVIDWSIINIQNAAYISINKIHKDLFTDSPNNLLPKVAHIPLQFWFCRNFGLALPIVALQYHDIKLNITFGKLADLISSREDYLHNPTTRTPVSDLKLNTAKFKLLVDYVYLDVDERRRFVQSSHEYLIEQLQCKQNLSGRKGNINFNFNHPVKELIFTGSPNNNPDNLNSIVSPSTPTTFSSKFISTGDSESKIELKLNNQSRFIPINTEYFTRDQIYNHHTGNGGVTLPESIGVYSFSLKPEEHQPSGICNFSRIDNSQLTIHDKNIKDNYSDYHHATGDALHQPGTIDSLNDINIYAINYNILRIMSGMSTLLYTN